MDGALKCVMKLVGTVSNGLANISVFNVLSRVVVAPKVVYHVPVVLLVDVV
jgi:hypothetical protein